MTISRPLRVFVVEDEAMVAMMVEDMLSELGHQVVATASRLEAALTTAKSGVFDIAILDVNLDGVPSFPIAEVLLERRVPVIFATGYGSRALTPALANCPALAKPFAINDLQAALARI